MTSPTQALRSRARAAEIKQGKVTAAEKQAIKDAARRAPSGAEKEEAIRRLAAEKQAQTESDIKAFRKLAGKGKKQNSEAVQARKAMEQAQAEKQAEEDARKRPERAPSKLKKGETPSLHQQSLMQRERDANARDENREAARSAGVAVLNALNGTSTQRGRHSRAARANKAQAELDKLAS